MRVLLVDDEPLALRRLILVLGDMQGVEIVGTAGDGEAALTEARRLAPDLIILDVEMPGPNGIAVAAELNSPDGPEIVILSAFNHYAAEAFDIEAVDYLLKPLRADRLQQAIDRADRRRKEKAALLQTGRIEAVDQTAPGLRISDRHGGFDLKLSDIVWIEAARDYALIHTSTRTHILRTTMAELTRRLPPSIRRVHRSAFVALDHVRRWAPPLKGVYQLILSDGAEIQVAPSYVAEIRSALRPLGC